MSASDFFDRWSKRKSGPAETGAPQAEASPAGAESATAVSPAAAEPRPAPVLADVEKLTPESDYSAFVAKGVDENVKRSALKKLFADPRFNVMDGLDTYIGDYAKPDPIPAAMLAALHHAKNLLDPLGALSAALPSADGMMQPITLDPAADVQATLESAVRVEPDDTAQGGHELSGLDKPEPSVDKIDPTKDSA